MKKKTMLLMSFVLAVVMSVAVFAAGCGGGISRGGGGGQQMANETQWLAAIALTETRIAETNREMRWTTESRSEHRGGNNRHTERSSNRTTIGNGGNHIQVGNTFLQFTNDNDWMFERDASGVWRRQDVSSWGWRPAPNINKVWDFDFEFFDFSGGRHVLNHERYLAAGLAAHLLAGGTQAQWDAWYGSGDRTRLEITIRDGVITNIYFYERTRHPHRSTTESRLTIDWGWSGNISLPTHVAFPTT